MNPLLQLKLLLGIEEQDVSRDSLLQLILNMASERLTVLLGGRTPPEELQHIVVEASVARYNRIGSEGLNSHTVEGESLAFAEDDFENFSGELQAWLAAQDNASGWGKVRFL